MRRRLPGRPTGTPRRGALALVFVGGMTYIGSGGPNFMVKSIAESVRVRVPTLFGYVAKYSLPILLPILAVVGWLFLT